MVFSVHNQVITKIKEYKRGNLIFLNKLLQIGPETAVRQSLSRLTKEGMLIRVAHGIYLYPKQDKELGTLFPSVEEIAKAIAKKERIRIIPTGSYALNRLGLSTQIPMKVTYLTDGKSKNIKVGKNTISFKRVSPIKLSAKGEISGLVIQALEELGKENIKPAILNQLNEMLQKEEPSLVRTDAKLAPAWIARILYSSLEKALA